jgi:REP-associated tyrosine transposase
MARRPRIFAPGLLYHVIVRGNQRQKTFLADRDYQAYLERLAKYRGRYRVSVYAYCLMPNHVHLLLGCSDIPLSRFMQGLQQSYTQYFNRAHHKVGHLFQGRYKAIVCDRDEYLLELVRYIHLNPVRSKLAAMPEAWRYSGHGIYLGRKASGVMDPQPVFKLLGGSKAYRRFVLDGLGQAHKEDYYRVEDQRFLGAEEFVKRVQEKVEGKKVRLARKSLSDVVEKMARRAKVNVEALKGPDRSWAISRVRGLVVYLLVRRLGFGVKEVGKYLNKDETSISTMINRVYQRIRQEGLGREIERLCQNV